MELKAEPSEFHSVAAKMCFAQTTGSMNTLGLLARLSEGARCQKLGDHEYIS
jgi:hypothetical protein